MFTEIEKHEIHCAKRYLDYTEDAHFRALRDRDNPASYESNYAVLKDMDEIEADLARIDLFYLGTTAQPKIWSRPDAAPLCEVRGVLEQHGYTIKEYETTRMTLTEPRSPMLLVHKCPIKCHTGSLTEAESSLVNMSCDGMDYGIKMVQKQMAAGARIFIAYAIDGTPVSMCLAEGYGSAFGITDVFTAYTYRERGFAAAVILEAIRYAKDVGYTDIFLECSEEAPLRLYEKIGFRGEQVQRYWAFKGSLPSFIENL